MKLSNIFLIGIAAFSLTACDDLFEPAIENNQNLSYIKDPVFARGLLDNAYLALPYSSAPSSDLATDDAVTNELNSNYMRMATGAWTAEMNPVSQWDGRYHAIQYCNLLIENYANVEWSTISGSLNEMYKDNFLGNAYALRGLHLFHLLRAHAGMVDGVLMGVPIHLKSEDESSDFNQERATFKDCIDRIMEDFDEALKYLPMQYNDIDAGNPMPVPDKYAQLGATAAEYNRAFGKTHRGKIDGRTIAAFKAQVAIFAASPAYSSANAMTYEQAAKYAADCLKNASGKGVEGVAGMDPDGYKWFISGSIDNLGTADNLAELVWRGNVEDNRNLESDNYPPSLYGKGRVNPTQNLVDAFPMANGYPVTDATNRGGYDQQNPYANRDKRLQTYIIVNGDKIGADNGTVNTAADSKTLDGINRENGSSTKTGYYLRKLLRGDVQLNPAYANTKKHLPARIRYTEIFLDYAEAANEAQGPMAKVGGASFSAYDVIKAIRSRAGITDTQYLDECAQDKKKMSELIRNERRLELCFENHRFWDLRRWKANLNETAKGVSISTDGTSGNAVYNVIDVEERKYDDYMYYGPIPYFELLKWSNLKQNDGWK